MKRVVCLTAVVVMLGGSSLTWAQDALIGVQDASWSVHLYNRATDTTTAVATYLHDPNLVVEAVGTERDGLIGGNGTLYAFDGATDSAGSPIGTVMGHFSAIEALANGDALVAPTVNVFRYDGASGVLNPGTPILGGAVQDMCALPGGDALAALSGFSGSLWVYDAATQAFLANHVGSYMGSTYALEALPNGDALVGVSTGNGSLFVYDGASQTLLSTAVGSYMGTIYAVEALPNGDALVAISGGNGELWVYDGTTGALRSGAIGTVMGTITAVTSLGNGDALIGTADQGLWRYDGASGHLAGSALLWGPSEYIVALPNGDALIYNAGMNGSLYVYYADTQTMSGTIGSYMGGLEDMVSLGNGDALLGVTETNGSVWRYDGTAGTWVGGRLMSYAGKITGIAVLALAPQTCLDIWQAGQGMATDLNQDCVINLHDFSLFAADWLVSYDPLIEEIPADWNEDDIVDIIDVSTLAGDWLDSNDPEKP